MVKLLMAMSPNLQNVVVDNPSHHHHVSTSRLNSFRSAKDLGNTFGLRPPRCKLCAFKRHSLFHTTIARAISRNDVPHRA